MGGGMLSSGCADRCLPMVSECQRRAKSRVTVFSNPGMSLKSLVETGKGKPSPNDTKIDNWN